MLANVGWFYQEKTPAVAPDCLLSLDVICPQDLHIQQGRSYYQWRMGKPPDVVIEMVSDKQGGEDSFKRDLYARQGVPYYAIYDPEHHLSQETLRTFGAERRRLPTRPGRPLADHRAGFAFVARRFRGHEDEWLRWCGADGEIIPTAEESASLLAERARRAEERVRQLEEECRRLKGEPPPT